MTRRVLFVDHSAVMGGAELSLLDIARHHGDRGTVALFADGPFRERLERAGLAVRVLDLGDAAKKLRRESARPTVGAVLVVLRAAVALARLARRHDVLYANSQKAFVVSAIAACLARRPVVWHLRDILDHDHFSATNVRIVVALANRIADRVVTNSHATADAFVARGGRRDRVCVVHNGIDAALFAATDAEDAASLRESLGVGDAPVVATFSRLSPWKGQHVLLDALPELPGVHALFVGEALFGEDAYAARLHQRAAELGVADRAHFLGFRDDIPRLMRVADAVAHTSVSAEPFGRVIVEGMLAGKPVVATRAGGAVEILRDGVTGLLVTPGDAGELAAALRGTLRTRRGAALAAAGCVDARARFGVDTMLAGVSRVIAEVA